ncbi:MAG: TonB family protein [Desulfovibrio sp.]|nr:TonB family protein [Desulfovibrio sp.]
MTQKPLAFQWALLLSFLLHTSLLLTLAGGNVLFPLKPPQEEVLVMDLFGMISNRQVEERHIGAEEAPGQEPEAEQAHAPEPMPKPAPGQEPKKVPVQKNVPPVQERPKPILQPRLPGSQEEQIRQTVSKKELEASLMRQYLASLSKAVRGRLRYPVEARAKGYTGVVAVSFVITVDGQMLPGSEAVRIGSGSPVLDNAALKAVRDSEDLLKPPRQMEVVVSINFAESH